ncbi:MAG: hypothetical protein JW874_09815 [Spirochaetales bacterium]|nr:hypothetical protein [Spirochaetales bacterium]
MKQIVKTMRKGCLFFCAAILLTIALNSCFLFNTSITVTVTNESSHNLSHIYLETGYEDVGNLYDTYSLTITDTLSPGESISESLYMPTNGSGDYEYLAIEVEYNGETYDDYDTFSFYGIDDTRDTATVIIEDDGAGLDIDIDIE